MRHLDASLSNYTNRLLGAEDNWPIDAHPARRDFVSVHLTKATNGTRSIHMAWYSPALVF